MKEITSLTTATRRTSRKKICSTYLPYSSRSCSTALALEQSINETTTASARLGHLCNIAAETIPAGLPRCPWPRSMPDNTAYGNLRSAPLDIVSYGCA
jgi:hypothetical protein